MTEPILIWGAGAIGGTLGAAFTRAGHSVVFVRIFLCVKALHTEAATKALLPHVAAEGRGGLSAERAQRVGDRADHRPRPHDGVFRQLRPLAARVVQMIREMGSGARSFSPDNIAEFGKAA